LEFPNCLAIIIINYRPDIKPFSGAVAGERRRIISLVNWPPSNAIEAMLSASHLALDVRNILTDSL
jgi:hypothetical protein